MPTHNDHGSAHGACTEETSLNNRRMKVDDFPPLADLLADHGFACFTIPPDAGARTAWPITCQAGKWFVVV